MPFRSNTSGFGGFGAFTPNPVMRYPGGQVLASDVDQARYSMEFGGDGGPPRSVVPYTPPAPTATPAPARTATTGDNSNAGVVNPRLFRQDNRANKDFWEQGGHNPNQPHVAMEFDDSTRGIAEMSRREPIGAELTASLPRPVGEPTVQTPRLASTSTGVSAGNLDTEQSLFPGETSTNAFDQWWKTSTDAPSVTVNAGDSGGSIWNGDHTLSNFGNDVALGSDLSTSLDDLGLGTGYPASDAALAPEPPLMADTGTGIPVEPAPLPQDYEWTTSPDDRRYLPGSELPVDAPPTPTRTIAGTDLRNFGDPGRLSLGAYLNASLGSLRYGEGYPIEYGGRPPDLQAGEGYIAPETQTGGHWVDEPGGQRWVENSPGSTGFDDTPTGAAVSPDVRRGELINEGSSPSFGIIGQGGLPLHVTPTARTNPFNYGYGQSATSQENAALMSSTAFGGNPNVTRVSDEERIASSMNNSLRAEAGFGKPATAANRYRDFMSLYGRTGVHTKAELTAGATGRGG